MFFGKQIRDELEKLVNPFFPENDRWIVGTMGDDDLFLMFLIKILPQIMTSITENTNQQASRQLSEEQLEIMRQGALRPTPSREQTPRPSGEEDIEDRLRRWEE
ncbi:hypothetical protein LCGC14_3039850, partial [marine sediment metagenome]